MKKHIDNNVLSASVVEMTERNVNGAINTTTEENINQTQQTKKAKSRKRRREGNLSAGSINQMVKKDLSCCNVFGYRGVFIVFLTLVITVDRAADPI